VIIIGRRTTIPSLIEEESLELSTIFKPRTTIGEAVEFEEIVMEDACVIVREAVLANVGEAPDALTKDFDNTGEVTAVEIEANVPDTNGEAKVPDTNGEANVPDTNGEARDIDNTGDVTAVEIEVAKVLDTAGVIVTELFLGNPILPSISISKIRSQFPVFIEP